MCDEPNLDWEDRQEGTKIQHHMLAGASAGMMEHVAMFPLDTIKTRMQAFSGPARTTFGEAVHSIYGTHGLRGFVRGSASIAAGCVPAHIGLFTVYEKMMDELDVGQYNDNNEITPFKAAVCGSTAQLVHDVILTPIDLIKQRLQLGCYKGFSDCFLTTYRQEGFLAFYRSLPVSLMMTIPSGGVFVSANETLKTLLGADEFKKRNPDSSLKTTGFYVGVAGVSGCVSALVTQPFDMVKTRIQTQDILQRPSSTATSSGVGSSGCSACSSAERPKGSPPVYRDIFSATKQIYREIGITGFWRGSLPRMLFVAPSAGLCWGTYEFVKGSCLKFEDDSKSPAYGIGRGWHASSGQPAVPV